MAVRLASYALLQRNCNVGPRSVRAANLLQSGQQMQGLPINVNHSTDRTQVFSAHRVRFLVVCGDHIAAASGLKQKCQQDYYSRSSIIDLESTEN